MGHYRVERVTTGLLGGGTTTVMVGTWGHGVTWGGAVLPVLGYALWVHVIAPPRLMGVYLSCGVSMFVCVPGVKVIGMV